MLPRQTRAGTGSWVSESLITAGSGRVGSRVKVDNVQTPDPVL